MGDSVKLAAIIAMLASVALGQTNLISPTMTSASAPSPYVVSSSADYFSYQAWTMFDGGITYYWFLHDDNTGASMAGNWWKIDMGAEAKAVSLYQFSKYGLTSSPYPSAWTLAGSNNGTDWTTIDSRSGITISDSVLTSEVFAVTSPVTYTYVRFTIDEVSSTPYKNNCGMDDFKMWEVIVPPQPPPACAVMSSASSTGVSILSGPETGITVLQ